ncbi:MAG: hypothetical protein CMJ78_17555 [Planctomycetaceae bacterium]|nr:hypothetical protein [Planctomycetaceae bacterium]
MIRTIVKSCIPIFGSVLPKAAKQKLWQGYKFLYVKTFDSAFYQRIFNRRVDSLSKEVLQQAFQQDSDYEAYVNCQIEKSLLMVTRAPQGWGLGERTVGLVGFMQQVLPSTDQPARVLCVGCRNGAELDYIEETCNATTQGLDLFSQDNRITVGDMHAMPFANDSFDVVYSCHSLEHAFDIKQAISEFYRLARPEGIIAIEIPIKYELSDTDRWDVGSVSGLLEHFGSQSHEVLKQETSDEHVRVVIRVRKLARKTTSNVKSASTR